MLSACTTAAARCYSRPAAPASSPGGRPRPPLRCRCPSAAAARLMPGAGAPRRAGAWPVPPGGGGDTKGLTGQVTNPRAAQLPGGGAGPPGVVGGGGARRGERREAAEPPAPAAPAEGPCVRGGVLLLLPSLSGGLSVGWRHFVALWKGCRYTMYSCRLMCQKTDSPAKVWVPGELTH